MKVIVARQDPDFNATLEGEDQTVLRAASVLMESLPLGTVFTTFGSQASPSIEVQPLVDDIDTATIAEIFEWGVVKADLYRVVVMTEFAMRAGREGLDYEAAKAIYAALDLDIPRDIRTPFRNASNTKGFLRSLGKNLWATTDKGKMYVEQKCELAQASKLINTPGNSVVETGPVREP